MDVPSGQEGQEDETEGRAVEQEGAGNVSDGDVYWLMTMPVTWAKTLFSVGPPASLPC